MNTYMANAQSVQRKWYVVDADGMVLGRLASQVATILRGKHKPTYTPHVDGGDFVIILNCSKVKLTGKKLDQKIYYHHTGYVGGLKETKYRDLMAKKPDFAVKHAVKGMLPKGPPGPADADQAVHLQRTGTPPAGAAARSADAGSIRGKTRWHILITTQLAAARRRLPGCAWCPAKAIS